MACGAGRSPVSAFSTAAASAAKVRELGRAAQSAAAATSSAIVEHFSGGNQQKVLLAKALGRDGRGCSSSTSRRSGVDVGTRVAIYGFIRDLCEGGAGVLLISSDLPEILHLTHRAYVMYRGELRAELAGAEITQDRVLGHFFERRRA